MSKFLTSLYFLIFSSLMVANNSEWTPAHTAAVAHILPYRDTTVRELISQAIATRGTIQREKRVSAMEELLTLHKNIDFVDPALRGEGGTKKHVGYLKTAMQKINWPLLEKNYRQLSRAQAFEETQIRAQAFDETQIRALAFEETQKYIQQGYYTVSGGRKITIAVNDTVQKYEDSSFWEGSLPSLETTFSVTHADTLDQALELIQKGRNNLAVLDMANRNHAGGAPQKGAPAQEEQICYRSTLFPILENYAQGESGFIPVLGALYLPEVTVFRDNEETGYALREEPFKVSVIASAAFRAFGHRNSDAPETPQEYKSKTKEKIRSQLAAALGNGHTDIVLGAFGCGAFKNEPEDIAQFYYDVFEERRFKNKFNSVTFAIYTPPQGDTKNYDVFSKLWP